MKDPDKIVSVHGASAYVDVTYIYKLTEVNILLLNVYNNPVEVEILRSVPVYVLPVETSNNL